MFIVMTNLNTVEAGVFLTHMVSQEASNTYQELMVLMNLYPVFVGLALLIYILILTYLLIGLHHHHG